MSTNTKSSPLCEIVGFTDLWCNRYRGIITIPPTFRGSGGSSTSTPVGQVQVAIKVIDTEIPPANQHHKNASKDQVTMRTQFFQEVDIMTNMHHPNICKYFLRADQMFRSVRVIAYYAVHAAGKFYGSCVDGPNWCLVCEYMPNGNLYDRLGGRDPKGAFPVLRLEKKPCLH